mmetsp:Transcript_618/g.1013  ORF Transcript_618/g.1013 Transcript_618/m.1013 type:complete len:351 (+) Transcript_618:341-1393(+)
MQKDDANQKKNDPPPMQEKCEGLESDFQNMTLDKKNENKMCLGKTIINSFESRLSNNFKNIENLKKSVSRNVRDKCCCKNSTRIKGNTTSSSDVSVKKGHKIIKKMLQNQCGRGKYCDPKIMGIQQQQQQQEKSKKFAHYPYVVYSENPSVLCTIDRNKSMTINGTKPSLTTRMVNSPFLKRFGKMYCAMQMNPEHLLSSVLGSNNESELMQLLLFAFSHFFLNRISFPCYFPKLEQSGRMSDDNTAYELCVVDCSCREIFVGKLEIWIRILPSSNIHKLEQSPCRKPNFKVLSINNFNAPLNYTPITDDLSPEEQAKSMQELHQCLTQQFLYQLNRLVACRIKYANHNK